METEIVCKAECKLSDVSKTDYAETTASGLHNEFLRKQLMTEVDIALTNLKNTLYQIDNNFSQTHDIERQLVWQRLLQLKHSYGILFDAISEGTSL